MERRRQAVRVCGFWWPLQASLPLGEATNDDVIRRPGLSRFIGASDYLLVGRAHDVVTFARIHLQAH